MEEKQGKRESFATKFGVIAATAGSAVGLGNIWRFPYLTGENGGAAFILVYLGFILAFGIPVMLSEFVIGRSAQKNPFGAFRLLAPRKPWYLVGLMGIVAAFLILAFYTTVAGWTLEYLYQTIIGGFGTKSPQELTGMFAHFKNDSWRPVLWFLVFMGMTAGIIMSGVQKGIEKSTKIMMPMLVLILVGLCIRSLTLPGSMAGVQFLFNPDFSKLTTASVLNALGQVFFSMSVGMGTLITYSSYFPKSDNLAGSAFSVAFTDLVVAILAGVVIFPAAFSFAVAPDQGPGLVFITLPLIFEKMAGGMIFGALFFILLGLAALTSTISVLEVIVAFFIEELKLSRKAATWLATVTVSVLGVLCALSWHTSFTGIRLFNLNVFELLEFTSANVLLPLGGLFIVLFIAWFHSKRKTRDELSNQGSLKVAYFPVYLFVIRFIAPIGLVIIFLNGLGLLKL